MNRYADYSKEDLIRKLEEKEDLINEMKERKSQEEFLNFPWADNLGHWYWNVKSNDLIFKDKTITTLNYTKDEIPDEVGMEFFTSKIHPEDYEMVMEKMRQHLEGEIDVYEVQYRIQTKDGSWRWYYDIGKITKRDEDNNPYFLCGTIFDINKKKEMELTIKEQNEKLLELVNTDYLTKILNRKSLFERLDEEMSKSDRDNTKLSVIMMDLDKFTEVNNNYGHMAGDQVIKQTAEIVNATLAEECFVGRYGGEEYLIVLPNHSKEQAYMVGEKIRKNIENVDFIHGIKITISGGVKEYDNKELLHVLIDKSDINLYKAKNTGRNKIVTD